MNGIDVSTYQGYPDWKKVKASGIDFAMIKAGQGHAESSTSYLFQDSKFVHNISNAPAAGILCGTYYYFTARNEQQAIREAQHFISIMEPYKHLITLYAAVDVESKHLNGLLPAVLSRLVEIFCFEVKKAGYNPMVYTNPSWLKSKLDGINNRPLWLALWRSPSIVPSGHGDMKIWQWGTKPVNGIINNVDACFGYFDTVNELAAPIIPLLPQRESITAGCTVRVENPINYDNGKPFKLYYSKYTVISLRGDRAVIGIGNTITAAVHVDFLEKV